MVIPKRSIRSSTSIQRRARELRKQLTPAEAKLWERLRSRQLGGFKFRRQQPIGAFIADFYCASSRLIVEIDGGIHNAQRESDRLRVQQLTERGYQLIRFTNEEVEREIETVLGKIRDANGRGPLLLKREKREG